jgi:hypothetical protein
MAAVGFLDDGTDPEAGNDGVVRAGLDHIVFHQFLAGDDDGLAGQAGMDCGSQASPVLGIAVPVGPLDVEDAHVGVGRRYDGDVAPREGQGRTPNLLSPMKPRTLNTSESMMAGRTGMKE